jgi:uncharacterized repeat protein (TIGR03803 family)
MHRMLSSFVGVVSLAIVAIAPSQSRAANLTTLVSFNSDNFAHLQAGLIADAKGNLFGTTLDGGAYPYGTVFEIAKTAKAMPAPPSSWPASTPPAAGIRSAP